MDSASKTEAPKVKKTFNSFDFFLLLGSLKHNIALGCDFVVNLVAFLLQKTSKIVSWRRFGASWARLGASWRYLGPSSDGLGNLLSRLGASCGRLGTS